MRFLLRLLLVSGDGFTLRVEVFHVRRQLFWRQTAETTRAGARGKRLLLTHFKGNLVPERDLVLLVSLLDRDSMSILANHQGGILAHA